MNTLQAIKDAALTARKARQTDTALSLTTLYAEAVSIGKNAGGRETTDAETIAVVKKFIKNIDESKIAYESNHSKTNDVDTTIVARYGTERALYATFLPQQLTEGQITDELNKIADELQVNSPKQMGDMLKALKARFEGQYDGGTASRIAKEILSKR